MTQDAAPERLLPLLSDLLLTGWRILKLLSRYARFLLAAWFALVCVMHLAKLSIMPALIFAVLAFLVWPGAFIQTTRGTQR